MPFELLTRDIRVLGAQKSDYQKMGAALIFFFLRAHFLKKKIMGGAPIMRPLPFFFCGAHFLKKKIMGEVPTDFLCFSAWSQHIVVIKVLHVGI